jgi:hypothetical protein
MLEEEQKVEVQQVLDDLLSKNMIPFALTPRGPVATNRR